jgi:DNA repair/transcription protein MET18/MMS19
VLLQEMGADFVFVFIQQMDGEKDPRNLVSLFTIVPVHSFVMLRVYAFQLHIQVVIAHFPIDRFVEDLFAVVSCYFPITFTPPPGDKKGLQRCTAEGLDTQ